MNCPVCNRVGLSDALHACPQCDADLTCFKLLETLQEDEAGATRPRTLSVGHLMTVVILMVLVMAGGLVFYHQGVVKVYLGQRQTIVATHSPDPDRSKERFELLDTLASFNERMTHLQRQVDTLQTWQATSARQRAHPVADAVVSMAERLTHLERQVDVLRTPRPTVVRQSTALATTTVTVAPITRDTAPVTTVIDAAPATTTVGTAPATATVDAAPATTTVDATSTTLDAVPAVTAVTQERFFRYQTRPTSTLWTIAEKFYGRGVLYPLLMEYNPKLGIIMTQLDTVRILKDNAAAVAFFNRFSFRVKGRTFFRYKVGPDESWAHIAWKFYGDRRRAARLRSWNPRTELAAGIRINVLLE